MLKKGSLFSVAILFLFFVIGCSPPETCKESPSESCNPPTANAGDSITLTDLDGGGTELVNLDGTGSSGNIVEYEWSEEDAVLGTESTPSYAFSVGIHLVVLSVTNNCGATDQDAIYVNVLPFGESPPHSQAPIANAGTDQTILMTEASAVHLDGSGSYDPDGDDLNYLWMSVDETIALDPDNQSVTPEVSLPAPGDYFFFLIVDDGVSYGEPDMVTITVTEPDAWVDSALPNDIPSEFRFKTIQSAIDAVSDGTDKVIVIENGPYTEQISVASHSYLIGLTSQNGVVPQISSVVSDGEGVVTLRDSTTIENLRIFCEYGPGEASNKAAVKVIENSTNIKKCLINNSYSDGVKLEQNSSAIIMESGVQDVSGEGIEAVNNSNLVVKNCKILHTSGSAVWGNNCYSATIEDSIIHKTGYHGIHLSNCENARLEHCTIIDFSNNNSFQGGILITGGGSVTIKSNLIEIQDLSTLTGVNFDNYSGETELTYLYNYIYSKQQNEIYYSGDISIEAVDLSNYPNINTMTTSDPLIIDPDMGDFRLDPNSSAIGLGENSTNPGAEGTILSPP
jgi:hypothetical protein